VDYVPFLGVTGSDWAGLENFRRLFGDREFWSAVRNTVVIAGLQLVFFFPAPLALARPGCSPSGTSARSTPARGPAHARR
jgi:putative aldouronate transport system permease protein